MTLETIGTIRGNIYRLNAYALLVFLLLAAGVRVGLGIPLRVDLSGTEWIAAGGVLLLCMLLHELLHFAAALLFTSRASVSLRFRLLVWECRVNAHLVRSAYIFYSLFPAATMSATLFTAALLAPSEHARAALTLLLIFSLTLGTGDYWFVQQALGFPADAVFLDEGTRITVSHKKGVDVPPQPSAPRG
jgi:hypothetical protein